MPDYIAQYRIYLEQEKHASANTVSSYLRDVRQFAEWLSGDGLTLTQVTPDDVKRYASLPPCPIT